MGWSPLKMISCTFLPFRQLVTTTVSLLLPQELKHSTAEVNTANPVTQPTEHLRMYRNNCLLKVKTSITHTIKLNPKNHHQTQIQPPQLSTAITDSISMSRLPAPERTIFSGESIHYPDWKLSFHTLIHRKNL